MDMQTKKVSYELDERIVRNYLFHLSNVRELARETQGWSTFRVRSEAYCKKGCDLYQYAYVKLYHEIERVTHKRVLSINKDLSVDFEDGTKLKIVY